MSDEWVKAASFSSPVAAQVAMGRLEEEGIESFSTGDLSASSFGGVSALGGTVEIQVRAKDLRRGLAILAELEGERESDWESQAEEEHVWVCSLCGEPVPDDRDVCSSCKTPREAIRASDRQLSLHPRKSSPLVESDKAKREQITAEPPLPPIEDLTEDAPEIPNLDTFLADDLARRAFRAALFGAMSAFFPFTLYSFWLSFRLCLMPGELTPKNGSRLRWAIALNIYVGMVWMIIIEVFRMI